MKGRGIPVGFLDFALNLVCILLVLFVISNQEPPKKDNAPPIQPKAEFLITMTWDDNSQDDIDLYVRGPDGQIVFFKSKAAAYMFLDHDDTSLNDHVDGKDIPSRVEIVTVRAIVPGQYTVNAHVYEKRSGPDDRAHVKFRVLKLNPFSIVREGQTEFDARGEEKTLVNFDVAPDGSVSAVYVSPVKIIGAARASTQ